MDQCVGLRVITNANIGIQPDASSSTQRIVEVNKAAFRGLDVVPSKGIRNASELEAVYSIERLGVECH